MNETEQFLSYRYDQMEHALLKQLDLQMHDFPFRWIGQKKGRQRLRTNDLIRGLNIAIMGMCKDISPNIEP